jgi:nitrogenase molybdenum-iron protein beta chain
MSIKEEKSTKTNVSANDLGIDAIEAPRYSCALGGAYGTALGVYGVVPVIHGGMGCGLGQLFGQLYAGGQNAGGPQGGTSTPCSGLVEEHVIFGGEDKLRNLIQSSAELMEGDLYAVISGCVPSLIGDDTEAVIREFDGKVPLININAPGFSGSSYEGYELFFEAVIDQILAPLPKEKGVVNIFGIVPYQHLFWKGELAALKELLESIGLKPNIIFTEFDGFEKLKQIPAAEYNLIFSPWNGHRVVKKLEEKFKTPFITFPGVPIGPKQTSAFLRTVAKKLDIPQDKVEEVIGKEERKTYRFIEYSGDVLVLVRPNSYFAVVADSNAAISLTKFLVNEIGYLPDIVQITDNPPEEYREHIVNELTKELKTPVKPDIFFEVDSHKIRVNLRDRPFQFLFASSLEAPISMQEFGALHVTVAFPSYNRVVLNDSYACYTGSLRLLEDYISNFAGPL